MVTSLYFTRPRPGSQSRQPAENVVTSPSINRSPAYTTYDTPPPSHRLHFIAALIYYSYSTHEGLKPSLLFKCVGLITLCEHILHVSKISHANLHAISLVTSVRGVGLPRPHHATIVFNTHNGTTPETLCTKLMCRRNQKGCDLPSSRSFR